MLKSVTIFTRIVTIFSFVTILLEPSPFWLKPSRLCRRQVGRRYVHHLAEPAFSRVQFFPSCPIFPPADWGEKLDTRGKIGHENRSACEAWGGLNNFKMSAPRAGFGHFEFAKSYVILYIITCYYIMCHSGFQNVRPKGRVRTF